MSYRDKPDIWGAPLKEQDPKAMRWALVAIMLANLGPLVGRTLKGHGFQASAEALTIGAFVMGAICIIGAVVAYRHARRAAAQHVAELTGDLSQRTVTVPMTRNLRTFVLAMLAFTLAVLVSHKLYAGLVAGFVVGIGTYLT